MKFSITIEDTVRLFRVNVHDEITGNIIFACGWHGGEFTYQNKQYCVYGPYHNLEYDGKYRVYEIVPVSDPA